MEPNSMADLQSAVTAFSNSWLPVVSGLAAVGVIAMALIELLKSVFNLRRQYQRYAFKKWLDGQSAKFAKNFAEIDAPQSKIALVQIVGLATGGDENSLFDLKIDRFAGQLNAAVQVMLAYPANFKDGIKILAVSASEADLKAFLNGPAANADADARMSFSAISTPSRSASASGGSDGCMSPRSLSASSSSWRFSASIRRGSRPATRWRSVR